MYNLPNVNFSNEQQDVILLFEKQIDFIKNGGRQPCQVTIVQRKGWFLVKALLFNILLEGLPMNLEAIHVLF